MVGQAQFRTKADDTRFGIIREIRCIACAIEYWSDVPCEVHHLLEGYRAGHRYTLGLCVWHHRGDVAPIFKGSIERMTLAYGASLAHNRRAFVERYGTDDELLAIQDAAIRIVMSAQRRAEYLPPTELARIVRLLHREVVHHRAPNADAVRG